MDPQKGNVFCVNTKFGFYYVRVEYTRQKLCYTVKLYEKYPEVEFVLPNWVPFFGGEAFELKEDPLFQKTFFLSDEPNIMEAVKKTIYRFEWPKYIEAQIHQTTKNLTMDYERLTQEIRKQKKFSQVPSIQEQRKVIDLRDIKIHDWQDDLENGDEVGA